MKTGLQVHSKIGIIPLILCLVSVGLVILIKATAPDYNIIAFLLTCIMVVISIIALITAIVALRKGNTKRLLPIVSIVIASLLIVAGGFVVLDRLLAIFMQGYFMGGT